MTPKKQMRGCQKRNHENYLKTISGTIAAIQSLRAAGATINLKTVSDLANIPLSSLYSNSEAKKIIQKFQDN